MDISRNLSLPLLFSKLLEIHFILLDIYFYTGQKILFVRFLKLEKKLFTGKKVFFTGRLNCRQNKLIEFIDV